jgi:glutamate synthase domain-containing protein 2/glutamate synthase domain-containing protein 1/glutamate synthase domain-containing protein 3
MQAAPHASTRYAPLWNPAYEHDACGVGLVVDIAGTPSRSIVDRALAGLVNLTHRGGVGADSRTGDGAGVLTQIPLGVFKETLAATGHADVAPGELGVAMVFLPTDGDHAGAARVALEAAMAARGIAPIAWREVPTDPDALGEQARQTMPRIAQLLVRRPAEMDEEGFERALFLARKAAERAATKAGWDGFFVVSCSARTLIYKAFCLPRDLPKFYLDLQDPAFESAIVLFHQRYSTNTLPTWGMAQPFRYLAHNGEINTIGGNRSWMEARAPQLCFPDGEECDALRPVVSWHGSDSLSLDDVVGLLYHGGRSLPHALMMLVPEPWEQLPEMDPTRRAFYDFHAGLVEQWDGPAALGFSDGVIAGATVDRNGLRPLRYAITADGLFIAGSEAGTVEVDQATVIEKGRLGPGQMIAVDTRRGLVLHNDLLKGEVSARQPYAEWLQAGRVRLDVDDPAPEMLIPAPSNGAPVRARADQATVALQRACGYTAEDLRLIVNPMAEGQEPTWSMGDDAPLAVLSERPRPLHAYFRQRFAQVTNPAIDSLRERKIMALDSFIGRRSNLLEESPAQARLLHLPSIVVGDEALAAIKRLDSDGVRATVVSTLLAVPIEAAGDASVAPTYDGVGATLASPEAPSTDVFTPEVHRANGELLNVALDRIIAEAEAAVRAGAGIILLSDQGIDENHAPVPILLAVGTVHHGLIRAGLRNLADIVVESGEVCDVHALACLIGYGASAVNPYVALAAAGSLSGTRGYEELASADLQRNYLHSLEKGFLKVASKMGISTAMGYRGAQIFETLGLAADLIERHFTGTPARLCGIGLAEIEADVLRRHRDAYADPAPKLADPGFVRYRKDGEAHAFEPPLVKLLQEAVNDGGEAAYRAYREHVANHPPTAVRDLLRVKPLGAPVPLEEVEPVEAIFKRFVVTAMSLGALSPEAHRTLAIAMNRLGARSNSGEGGEDESWYDESGPDIAHNKVKQVASGRFGVTARYLAMAEELEIKIAQGSKPGEGGQIPAHKVTEFIARVRKAVPGLPLISPPPHHDIYSIEDLAQLIYDLRQINPNAKIGVKLVAEAGVGTVAAGVAKARADYVLISGHSGGTGASPLASIKHAGSPWELGLAEAQQTLVMNGLRSRVRLRTDGGIKTAEDVIVAAVLGAEEFGFGTSVLVAIGCDMARQCHLNSCPTGIATQREELRAKYTGTPEQVVAYFTHLANAIREQLAALGARSIDELVGRTDLLAAKELPGRAGALDVSELFAEPAPESQRRKSVPLSPQAATLDDAVLELAGDAIANGEPVAVDVDVRTENRTVGAKVAHAIAVAHPHGLPDDTVSIRLTGSAGQSFGAFVVDGMRLELEGEANDYVGKGMAGGEVAIRPPAVAPFDSPQAIAGNTILYGATGGRLFLAGQAGERFAVRNSGATSVVEGIGDHGCEYMTGGLVAVLGPTGYNFGAGMTNGTAYVYDPDGVFPGRINGESVLLEAIPGETDARQLRDLIARHAEMTGSKHARRLLAEWETALSAFWKVIPRAALASRAEVVAAEPEPARGAAD